MHVTVLVKAIFKNQVQIVFAPAVTGNDQRAFRIKFSKCQIFLLCHGRQRCVRRIAGEDGLREIVFIFDAERAINVIHHGVVGINVFDDVSRVQLPRPRRERQAVVMVKQRHALAILAWGEVVKRGQRALVIISRGELILAAPRERQRRRSGDVLAELEIIHHIHDEPPRRDIPVGVPVQQPAQIVHRSGRRKRPSSRTGHVRLRRAECRLHRGGNVGFLAFNRELGQDNSVREIRKIAVLQCAIPGG